MPEEAPAQTKQTWAEWFGPKVELDSDTLMTRAEFLSELARSGIAVTAPTLAHWEKISLIPRGIRGKRYGAPQSLYPPLAIPVVRAVYQFRQGGRTLDQIRHDVRGFPAQLVELPPDDWTRERLDELLNTSGDATALEAFTSQMRVVVTHLYELARAYEQYIGESVASVELRIIPSSGKATRLVLELGNDGPAPEEPAE